MNRAWNLNVIIFCLGVISYYSCYCFQTSRTFAKIEQKKHNNDSSTEHQIWNTVWSIIVRLNHTRWWHQLGKPNGKGKQRFDFRILSTAMKQWNPYESDCRSIRICWFRNIRIFINRLAVNNTGLNQLNATVLAGFQLHKHRLLPA